MDILLEILCPKNILKFSYLILSSTYLLEGPLLQIGTFLHADKTGWFRHLRFKSDSRET